MPKKISFAWLWQWVALWVNLCNLLYICNHSCIKKHFLGSFGVLFWLQKMAKIYFFWGYFTFFFWVIPPYIHCNNLPNQVSWFLIRNKCGLVSASNEIQVTICSYYELSTFVFYFALKQFFLIRCRRRGKRAATSVPWSSPGCRTGNGEKLSCSQAEPGQSIK